jgi:hypothetical protein
VEVNTTAPVEIRNLTILTFPGCVQPISGHPECDGIITDTATDLNIDNVTISGTVRNGIIVNGGNVALHSVQVVGPLNTAGVVANDATVRITDSIFRGAAYGIQVNANTTGSHVMIERSTMDFNFDGLSVNSTGPASVARISDCLISGNNNGIATSGAGAQIITFRNNTWAGNSTDGATPFSVSLK